ncbi:MAG: tetratricopeptide repeat-containing sensor histidine kinase [Cyclobacteriaceae bacterium]|nr:tetratricopeptide repeat-containing sensor histidine kinase [Cyclobacteriaceae bacterium]
MSLLIKNRPFKAYAAGVAFLLLSHFNYGQRVINMLDQISKQRSPISQVDSFNKSGYEILFTSPGEARILFNEAQQIATKNKYWSGLALSLKYKAISYDVQGNANEAIEYYLQALPILEQLKDTIGVARLKNNIGIAYKNLNDYRSANRYYNESIQLKGSVRDIKGVAYGYSNLGELKILQRQYEESLPLFNRAFSILDSLKDESGSATVLSNIGDVYLQMGDYKKSLEYTLRAKKIEELEKNDVNKASSYLQLAKGYYQIGEMQNAESMLDSAEQLATKNSALKDFYKCQLLRVEVLSREGDLKAITKQYEKILTLKDSIASIDDMAETARVREILESKQKEAEIAALKKEFALNKELLRKQQKGTAFGVVIIVLMVCLIILVVSILQLSGTKNRELKSKMEERDKAIEEAMESNRLKTVFMGTLSHEVRTPLQGIQGIVELMEIPQLSEAQRQEYLRIIKRRAIDLQNVIESLLDMASIETGRVVANPVRIDLHDVIHEIYHQELLTIGLHRTKVTYQLHNQLPIGSYADMDPQHLKQVLINLFTNATKFTRQGSIEVISAVQGDNFIIKVVDSGIGIKPENLKTIFEPFRQEDEGLNRSAGGMGLGLTICKRFVALWGGEITASANEEIGSTFYFTIPMASV